MGTVGGVPPAKRLEVEIGDRRLSLSNLDKVLYPEVGFTKGQVIDYYTRIAPAVLPHLRDRPLTLKRYPNGVHQQYFYEKQSPSHRPDWVQTAAVFSRHNSRTIDFTLCNDLPTLVWLANLADLELHTSLALYHDVKAPTLIAFDLDPGPPATIVECAEVALRLREAFEHLGLEAFPEDLGLEGDAGLRAAQHADHLRRHEAIRARARAGARAPPARARRLRHEEAAAHAARCSSTGARTTSTRRRSTSTRCAPASGRRCRRRWTGARSRPCSSSRDPEELSFTSAEVLARVEERGDLFAPVAELAAGATGGFLRILNT